MRHAAPEDDARPTPEGALIIHEDDWRQTEFIAPSYRPQVEQEFKAIKEMEQRQMVGNKMHLRSLIPTPMAPLNMMVQSLMSMFPGCERLSGIAIRGKSHPVASGFAFRTPRGMTFYGLDWEGLVEVLCVHSFDVNNRAQEDLDVIMDALPNDAIFIPWLSLGWVTVNEE